MNLTELKAKAYDIIATINFWKKELQKVNSLISKQLSNQVTEQKDAVESGKKDKKGMADNKE